LAEQALDFILFKGPADHVFVVLSGD